MLPSLMALPRASNMSVRLRPFLAPRWPCPFRGAVSVSPCVRLTIPYYLCLVNYAKQNVRQRLSVLRELQMARRAV